MAGNSSLLFLFQSGSPYDDKAKAVSFCPCVRMYEKLP